MIKRIERPDWKNIGKMSIEKGNYLELLDFWFDHAVEPINKALDSAAEVYGPFTTYSGTCLNLPHTHIADGHKALLINIEPIAKETVSDIAREMVTEGMQHVTHNWGPYHERLRQALEREK